MNSKLSLVTDSGLLRVAEDIKNSYLKGWYFLNREYILERGWDVVPVFFALGQPPEENRGIAKAIKEQTANVLLGIAVEAHEEFCISFEPSPEAITEFGFHTSDSSYFVTTVDREFALQTTENDLLIISGPSDFIQKITTERKTDAIRELYIQSQTYPGAPEIDAFFLTLADYYA